MTGTKIPLFRQAALDAQANQSLGSILLVRPISFTAMATLALVCAGVIVTFLFVGDYTKRAQVVGLLVPDSGLIRVSSPVAGVVIAQHVKEGQKVVSGQALFVLNAEKQLSQANGTTVSANGALDDLFRDRIRSLALEKQQQSLLTDQSRKQSSAGLQSMRTELTHLEQQIATQTERVASSQAQLQRWQNLTEQRFASELTLQQHRDELLEQRARLQTLEQSRIRLSREEAALASDLLQLGNRAAREHEQLQRASTEIKQARINGQIQAQVVVTAPISGTATTTLVEVGQTVGTQTLVSIVPEDAQLQAHLYAPSRAAGFVEAGQTVRLRYAAYPYQKFGQYAGQVLAVSRSPVSSQELPAALANLGQQLGGEGVYRITVQLASQSANVYGKAQALQAGMQLEADVLQDTRHIIEWMFESVLSLKGKL
nr:HlyD family efflux transporter periplasmic adaptor subunit [Rhodoferax sp.]